MTLTPALMTEGHDPTDQAVYTTASWTPRANKDYLIVALANDSTQSPTTPVLAGNGITWTAVEDTTYSTIAAPTRRLYTWRGKNASPSTGTLTFTFPTAPDGLNWKIIEIDGADAATFVVQTCEITPAADASVLTLEATFATAFGSASNGVMAFLARNTSTSPVVEPAYSTVGTLVAEVSPNMSLQAFWSGANDPTPSPATWTGTARCALIALEIKAGSQLTEAQKATFLPEVERLLAKVRGTLGRLLAQRQAGASVATPLARVRALQATLEGKYHDLITDATDVNDVLTVIEAAAADLLTQIGAIGAGAPTPVPLVKGLMNRESGTSAAPVEGWNPGGNQSYSGVHLTWAELQTTKGGAITGAAKTKLDTFLADTAHPMRLRVFCGHQTPQWVKDEVGSFTVFYANDPQNGSENVVKYWDPLFRTYYDDFINKMAALYDGTLPLIWMTSAMVVYGEPCLKQFGDARNRTGFVAAGWSKDEDVATFKAGIDSMTAFKRTRVGIAYNDYSYVKPDGTQATDRAVTDQLMDYHRQLFGERAVLQNNSMSEKLLTNSIYDRMAALGPPLSIQTAQWKNISRLGTSATTQQRHDALIAVLVACVDMGCNGVELPSGHTLTADELTLYDGLLTANP